MFIRTGAVQKITFGFASAITLFPFVLIGQNTSLNRRLVIHERIHLRQQAEMLVIPFYIWYLLEYLIHLLRFKNGYKAYRNISFEKEAYIHEDDQTYLEHRRYWSWYRYL